MLAAEAQAVRVPAQTGGQAARRIQAVIEWSGMAAGPVPGIVLGLLGLLPLLI